MSKRKWEEAVFAHTLPKSRLIFVENICPKEFATVIMDSLEFSKVLIMEIKFNSVRVEDIPFSIGGAEKVKKSVLISLRPKWCSEIIFGKKRVEVRKNKPKLNVPFSCLIYCTKDYSLGEFYVSKDKFASPCQGWVIGELVCDNIITTSWFITPDHPMWEDGFNEEMCLTDRELFEYSKGGTFYEWHISDLVIYDKPKSLSEFGIKKPPQSWCYVYQG